MSTKTKYKGTSLEEWAKANGLDSNEIKEKGISQTEGMSDTDYKIGQELYDAYLLDNEANTAHQNTLGQMSSDKAASKKAANISYAQLQKYLPQQLAKQGLYSKGVTEDAYLKLHNNYVNNLQDIDKDYLDRKTALEQSYQSDMTTRKLDTSDAIDDIIEKAELREEEEAEDAKTDQLNNYNDANELLLGGMFADANDVLATVEQYKDKVSDAQYQRLKNTAISIIKNDNLSLEGADDDTKAKVRAGKKTTVVAHAWDTGTGDDVDIILGGREYVLEIADSTIVEDEDLMAYIDNHNYAEGTVIKFKGEIYLVVDGGAYRLDQQGGSEDDFRDYNQISYYLETGDRERMKAIED